LQANADKNLKPPRLLPSGSHQNHFSLLEVSNLQSFHFSYRLFFACALCLLSAFPVWAQDEEKQEKMEEPTYLTARLFVVRVPHAQAPLTNQVFRLRTAAQTDDEKWHSNIKKAYPAAAEVTLLRTAQFRLFMRPRPGVIVIGDAKRAHIEVQFMTAQGLRDDDTINTTALSEVNFYSGSKNSHPIPLSMASQGFEVEPGLTYFYTADGLRLRPDWYTAFFRDGCAAPDAENFDSYIVVAMSSEVAKHTPFTFDETKSADLQAKATKKADAQWPSAVKKHNLFGKVQVRAEINAEGKVTNANIWSSTLPEGNLAALTAARLWEFPASELAGINAPASALLSFAIAPPEKKPEEKKPESTTGSETKPAGLTTPTGTKQIVTKPSDATPADAKSTTKKSPTKRRNK
jgi:TonB family protein